jgi:hypothetical protein
MAKKEDTNHASWWNGESSRDRYFSMVENIYDLCNTSSV